MSKDSESKIIVVESLFDTQTPVVQPFAPKKLCDIFNQLVLTNGVPGFKGDEEFIVFHASYIKALGDMLEGAVGAYFKKTEQSELIPKLPFSYMLDGRKLDVCIENLMHDLGVAESAFLQNRTAQQTTHFDAIEDFKREVDDRRYAFNLIAGQSFINVMSRLFAADIEDRGIYKRFMMDALSFRMAGAVLKDVAPLCEEGVLVPREDKQLTWGNLVREASPRLDPRYAAFTL